MLRLLILAVATLAVLGQEKPVLKDCAGGNSVVKLTNALIEPYPPKVPGLIKFSVDVELTQPLDNFDVNVTLIKDLDGFPLKIPCIENIGSCYYDDVCPVLDSLFPDGQCPPVVTQCRCPFKSNKIQIKGLEVTIPELPAEIAPLVPGNYELTLQLQDNASKSVLSCLNIKLRIVNGRLYIA